MNRKEELQQTLALHKQAINEDLEFVKTKGKRFALTALVAGGTFFLGYSIVKGITSSKKNSRMVEYEPVKGTYIPKEQPKPKRSGISGKLTGILLTELAILLVGVAKNEIKNYLSNFKTGNDAENTD